MPIQVVNTAQLMCSQGLAPSVLMVLPLNRVLSGNQPAANIMTLGAKPWLHINWAVLTT